MPRYGNIRSVTWTSIHWRHQRITPCNKIKC